MDLLGRGDPGEPMPTAVIVAIAIVAVFGAVVAGAVFILKGVRGAIDKSAAGTYEMFEPTEEDAAEWIRACGRTSPWAGIHGFEFVGWVRSVGGGTDCTINVDGTDCTFEIPYQCAAFWCHPVSKAWLCQAITGKKLTLEFTTEFAASVMLETSSTRDSLVFPPPPEVYRQAFLTASVDELWRRHTAMVEYIGRHGGRGPIEDPTMSIDQKLNAQQVKLGERIHSYSFYGLRSLVWMVSRPRKWRGLSIRDQHEKGMIKMPNEPARE